VGGVLGKGQTSSQTFRGSRERCKLTQLGRAPVVERFSCILEVPHMATPRTKFRYKRNWRVPTNPHDPRYSSKDKPWAGGLNPQFPGNSNPGAGIKM